MSLFTKDGRKLKSFIDKLQNKQKALNSISTLITGEEDRFVSSISLKGEGKLRKFISDLKFISQYPSHLGIKGIWLMSAPILFFAFATVLVANPWHQKQQSQEKYSIYSSKPLTLKSVEYQIYTRDSRAQRINAVFKEYNCPLEGLGEVFVYEADKHNIPWWLTAAMSFQESSCGKRTPEPSGLESYNAWGWAVYGDNVQTFDNWVRGIETVSQYMSDRFFSHNVTELCEIMRTYTPPSDGSWCKGVDHFSQEIQNYKTSETNL